MAELRVAYLNDMPHALGFGGKEVQLAAYQSFLAAEGSIDVVLLDPWDRHGLEGIELLHLFGSTKGIHTWARAARTNHPKLKIVISPNFFVARPTLERALAATAGRTPIPNIFSYRRETFLMADALIVNSDSERRQMRSCYGVADARLHVMHNGIEDDFTRLEDRGLFCRRMGIAPGYLLSVAFLDERKNSLRLIRAFLETRDAHHLKLVLVGGLRFGQAALAAEAADLIARNQDRILHVPYIDRTRELDLLKSAFANCRAHLLPSIIETPGISNMEAAAFGKPVLVGECHPVRDYFGDTAIYCDPRSVSSIARHIAALATAPMPLPLSDPVNRFGWSKALVSLPALYASVSRRS